MLGASCILNGLLIPCEEDLALDQSILGRGRKSRVVAIFVRAVLQDCAPAPPPQVFANGDDEPRLIQTSHVQSLAHLLSPLAAPIPPSDPPPHDESTVSLGTVFHTLHARSSSRVGCTIEHGGGASWSFRGTRALAGKLAQVLKSLEQLGQPLGSNRGKLLGNARRSYRSQKIIEYSVEYSCVVAVFTASPSAAQHLTSLVTSMIQQPKDSTRSITSDSRLKNASMSFKTVD